MTEREDRDEPDNGLRAEEVLVGPVEVFHEYGVAVGSGIGGRIDEGGDRVRSRVDEALSAVGEGVNDLITDLFGTNARAGVYATLRRTGGATAEEIADETGLTDERVKDALEGLEREGAVRRSGGRYEAVEPAELVRQAPGRVGDWIRSSIGEGGEGVRRLPIRGEKPVIDAEYDEESDEVTVRVVDPGDADYVEVVVGSEVRKYFEPPSEGDEFTVEANREEAVVARSGCLGD
jgi:DNA-binding Lrp family transcriptional regulator